MSGTEKLIEKIALEAKAEADKIIEDATNKVNQIHTDSRQKVLQIKTSGDEKASQLESEIIFRAKKNAELDAKKADLAVRHCVVDKAFNKALDTMRNMDAATCTEFLKQVMFKEAAGGEKVIPSKKHSYLIASVVPEINAMLEKENAQTLKLVDATDKIQDGFILEGNGYIKICSFEELLDDVKEKELGAVADILF